MRTAATIAASLVVGVVLTIATEFGINVYKKFPALKVAWEHTEVVSSIQVAKPTFAIKK